MKNLLSAFIILTLLFSLCACGTTTKITETQPTEPTKPAPVTLTKENIYDYLDYSTSYENGRITIKTWPKQPGKFIDCRIRVKFYSTMLTFPEGTNAPLEDYDTDNVLYQTYRLPTSGEMSDSSAEAIPYSSSFDTFFQTITYAEGTFYPD